MMSFIRKCVYLICICLFSLSTYQHLRAQCAARPSLGSIIPQTNWQTINYGRGGEAQLFVADSGCVYQFSYCVADGGFAPFDTEITIINNATLTYAGGYNDDAPGCGLAAKVTWTATSNGTFRIQTDRKPCANDTRLVTLAYRKVSCPPPSCAPQFMNVCIYDAPGGLGNCNFVGDLCSDGFTFGGDQKNSAPIILPELQRIDSIRFFLYTTGCPPNPVSGFFFYLNQQQIHTVGPGSFDCLCAAVDYPRIITVTGNQMQSAWNACGQNVISVAAGNDPNYAVSGYRAILFYTNKPMQVPAIVPLSTLCGAATLTAPPAPCNVQYFWQPAGCDTLRTFSAAQNYVANAPDTLRIRASNPTIPQCWSDTCSTFIVVAPVTGNILLSNQTICAGTMPSLISSATLSGGNGAFLYQWESSADSLSWTALLGETSPAFQAPIPLDTVWYRRGVFSGCNDMSLPVRILLESPISGNSIGSNQTICENQSPLLLTGSVVSGGSTLPVYQWLSSNDSLLWNLIPGASAIDYQPGLMRMPLWFSRIAQAGSCPPDTSLPVFILPQLLIGNNSIDAAQTICAGQIPVLLTGINPSGGNSLYQYQWQSSANGILWSPIATSTSDILQPNALFASTYFRRIVDAGLCPANTSANVFIQVNAPIGNHFIGASQTLCEGTMGVPLTGSIPSGGSGVYQFQWESSADLSLWVPITNATLSSHAWVAGLQNIGYRRIVSSGACPSVATPPIVMQITPAILNNTLGTDQTLCRSGTSGIISGRVPVSGGNGSYSYVWQTSSDASQWTVVMGETTSSYHEGILLSSRYYRRIVNSAVCTDTSVPQYWQVIPQISNNTIGVDQTLCFGNVPTLISGPLPLGTGPNPQYQWESSTNQSSWTTIPNATALSYQSNALTQDTWFRRVIISQTCVPLTTQPVSIRILPPLGNNSIAANQTLCGLAQPSVITGSLPVGGDGLYQYQWQESLDLIHWNAAPGAFQGQNYLPIPMAFSRAFRRILLSSTCASDTSALVRVAVEFNIGENTIGNAQTLCAGISAQTLTGSLPTGGSGVYAYIWQSSLNTSVWAFAGNGQQHAPGSPMQETWYRRVIQSGVCPPNTSLSVKLSVQAALGDNLIADNQVICETDTPPLISGSLPSGGNGVYHYEWESSINSLNWLSLPNTFVQDYQPPQVLQSVYYRRLVSSGFCPPSSSFPVYIRSDRVIGENTISGNQTLCSGAIAEQLTGTQPTGGIFSFQYVWQQSTDRVNWSNAPALHVLPFYAPSIISASAYFRRVVVSGVCPAITSNSIYLEVLPLPGVNVISGAQTICANQPFALLSGSIPTGANGQWGYEWSQSTDGINWLPASGNRTGQNYQPQVFSGTRWFRRSVSSAFCPELISNVIMLRADMPISGNIIGSNQTLCAGQTPLRLTGDLPTGVLNHLTLFWERSPDSITWFNAADTILHYQPDPAFNTYFYRRIVYAPICPADTSPVIAVHVQQSLMNNILSANQSLCLGMSSTTLTGSMPSGGIGVYQFQWQSSVDTQVWIACGNTQDFIPGTQSVTTYFRRLLRSGICPQDTSRTLSLFIEAPITHNDIGNAQTLCGGFAPAVLTGSQPSGGIGVYAFQWQSSTGPNSWQNIPGAFQQDYQPPILFVPTVFRRIVSGGACPPNISRDVLMQMKPKPVVHVQNDSICAGEMIRILATVDIPGGEYLWSPGGATTAFMDVSPTATQAYTVQYTFQGCGADASVSMITVVPKPLVQITFSGADVICVGATKLLNGSTDQSNVQWLWSTGATTQTLQTMGPGVFTLTGTNFYGCAATASINIRYASPPFSAEAPRVSGVCIGDQQQINIIPRGGVPPYTVIWIPAVGLSDPTSFSPLVTITGSATYVANVQDAIGCTASGSVSVGLNPPVTASFYIDRAPSDTLYFPDSVRLVNTSLNALDCTWDLGIDNRAHVCSPPAYQLLEEGKYTVQLWVVSPEGCRDSVMRDFWFHTQPTIAYPNAFSPNGDGINDVFRIPSLNVTEFGVFIFDRWGNQVFFSDNPKFTWDGTLTGQSLPDGVYIIHIQGQGMHGEEFEYQGSITLIR